MRLAQLLTSMVFSIRKKENIRVRQPLQKIMIPVQNEAVKNQIEAVKSLVLSEVNVKQRYIDPDSAILVKKVKPNFKTLGPKYGDKMKDISLQFLNFLLKKSILLNKKKVIY